MLMRLLARYRFQSLSAAQSQMEKEYEYKRLDSYKPALSLLFNSFILAQVRHICTMQQLCGFAIVGLGL
jgi:hypothetical protein